MRVREKGNPLLAPARLVKHGVDVMGDGASMVMAPIAAGVAKGSVAPALSMVFDNIKEAHVDEKYMPRWLLELIDAQLKDVHKESIEGLGDSVKKMLHTTNKERRMLEYTKMIRGQGVVNWRVHPYRAFRASLLNRLYPSGETRWWKLRNPLNWLLQISFFIHYAGFNDWFFIFLYALIDKRDEFQFVHVIAAFKIQQFFFSGVFPGISLMCDSFWCKHELAPTDGSRTLLSGQSAIEACTEYRRPDPFPADLDHYLKWGAEILRVLVIWSAYARLKLGRANGGPEQIDALGVRRRPRQPPRGAAGSLAV